MKKQTYVPAEPIVKGREDTFWYVIGERCISCGQCAANCPAGAIAEGDDRYLIDPARCIDCGTCSYVCPVQAAQPVCKKEEPATVCVRESISIGDIDTDTCYYNPGCALRAYKPDVPEQLLQLLRSGLGEIKRHQICCRHQPGLPDGSVIIGNCAGCDRRFRSLYPGIETISIWEVLDSFPSLPLPDYRGLTVSVHDSCAYRHKPQVHRAIRNLLRKMNITMDDAAFHGTTSICCGDNLYGHVPNAVVERRIQERVNQFPCENVVVYCIGCVRAVEFGGKKPLYMADLLLNRSTESMPDTLDEYHETLQTYIHSQ